MSRGRSTGDGDEPARRDADPRHDRCTRGRYSRRGDPGVARAKLARPRPEGTLRRVAELPAARAPAARPPARHREALRAMARDVARGAEPRAPELSALPATAAGRTRTF